MTHLLSFVFDSKPNRAIRFLKNWHLSLADLQSCFATRCINSSEFASNVFIFELDTKMNRDSQTVRSIKLQFNDSSSVLLAFDWPSWGKQTAPQNAPQCWRMSLPAVTCVSETALRDEARHPHLRAAASTLTVCEHRRDSCWEKHAECLWLETKSSNDKLIQIKLK